MPLHEPDIVAVQQPVDLLTGERDHVLALAWPAEFLLRQRLVPEHETVVLPQQTLDLVAVPVDEDVQAAFEGIVPQLLLHDGRQPEGLLAEIDGGPIEIDGWGLQRRPKIGKRSFPDVLSSLSHAR